MSYKVVAAIIWTLIIVLFIGVALLIRLWISGGEWGCVYSADPQLCVAVLNK